MTLDGRSIAIFTQDVDRRKQGLVAICEMTKFEVIRPLIIPLHLLPRDGLEALPQSSTIRRSQVRGKRCGAIDYHRGMSLEPLREARDSYTAYDMHIVE